ncbi:uncharacterized protein LOC105433442 [Pogonomyrmex barbatus]|uniref:Uncharacterized protein LOC105433442 n=1 Tax=Pogonomyrmex barbatus TaxID=144034 RepID=A0A6I9WUT7_9HYME|nr:uncharacterized protein LOC105433442 [Pogonomyrmex barbatus]
MFDRDSFTCGDLSIIYAMNIICEEPELPLLLITALIKNSEMNIYFSHATTDNIIEMILLEDSDLYAVISYLKIKPSSLSKITTIFVQESIKETFLWLIKKHLDFARCMTLPISVFHKRQELKSLFKPRVLNIVSIWSEDIIAAKDLAVSLNRDILFINSHMEICSGVKFAFKIHPYYDVSSEIYKLSPKDYTYTVHKSLIKCALHSSYNLFYDGTWQIPIKGKYWEKQNETEIIIYANATKDDVMRCLLSASEAFTIWSTWSMTSRIEALYRLASVLECCGKYSLAETVLQCIKLPDISENKLFYYQDERLEVSNIYKPHGVVWIRDCDESNLFNYLTRLLIKGNCVIVISDEYSSTIAPYCNMFITAKIPPGVINLLSFKNAFKTYEKVKTHMKHFCSLMKYIILPLQ